MDAAKRVFGVVGAGSVVGAVSGALAGGAVAAVLPVRHLLLGAAVLTALSALGVPALGRGGRVERPRRSLSLLRDLRAVHRHPYARRIVGLGVLATTAFTLVDYLFKAQVAAAVPAASLGSFFAGFYAITNALALVVQVVATGAVIRSVGVRRAVAVLPALLLVGSAGMVAGLGLLGAVALKGAEGALKHTLHRTSLEVLYVPVPPGLRARIRRVSDLLLLRGAQGLGSLLLLGALALGVEERGLAVGVAALAATWVGVAAALKSHYLALFRGILRRGSQPSALDQPAELDLGALEALLEALNSDEDDEVLAALDLLEQSGRARLVPSLLLFHPSTRVLVRTLDVLSRAGREDHLAKADRLAAHAEPNVRAAVVRAQPDRSYALRAMADPSAVVRGTALATLLGEGGAQAATVRPELDRVVAEGSVEERVALALALAGQPHGPDQVRVLAALARAPTATERAAVAECLARQPSADHVPVAIGLLGTRAARRAARKMLVAVGTEALPSLDGVLGDPAQPEGVRIHVPAVVAEIGGEPAAVVLTRWLGQADSGRVRYRVLRGLNRLHGLEPDLELPGAPLRQAVRREIANLYILTDWSLVLAEGVQADPARETAGHALLATLLQDKLASVRERLFRLLDLMYDGEDFEDLWRGVLSDDVHRRASSLELLEATLPTDLRSAARGLFDPAREEFPRRRRLAPGAVFHSPFEGDYDALVEAMLDSGSGSVQAMAAWHAGELGRVELLPALEALNLGDQDGIGEVVAHAIGRLRAASAARAVGWTP